MNLDEIAKYKVVDKDNLSNILIRLEKLNNILGNEITVVENKINTVNLKKQSNEIIKGINPNMYYIKNCLLDKLVFIAVMFILMFTVEKFTPTYLSDDLIQLVSLLITLIRIIIISSVVLISTVTILDLGYINRREFRDIADNCERRDGTNLISEVAKIAVMQKPGYTELEYNQIIDKVYNRKALDDRQDN